MFNPQWRLVSGDVTLYTSTLRYAMHQSSGAILSDVTLATELRTMRIVATIRHAAGQTRYAMYATRAEAMQALGITGALDVCPTCGHYYHVAGHASAHLAYTAEQALVVA